MPARDDVFPPWQGMQFMHDMFAGVGKLAPLDNDRYPGRAFHIGAGDARHALIVRKRARRASAVKKPCE